MPSDTLVLPLAEHLLAPAGRRRPRAARHRRATRSGRGSVIALTSVAGVAVIVIAVALTGGHPRFHRADGVLRRTSHPRCRRLILVGRAQTGGARQVVDGTGTARPTPSAAVTGSASVSPSATTAPDTLCREFYQPSSPPGSATGGRRGSSSSNWPLGRAVLTRSSTYCLRVLGSSWFRDQRPYPAPSFGGYSGGPGDRGGGHPDAPATRAREAQAPGT